MARKENPRLQSQTSALDFGKLLQKVQRQKFLANRHESQNGIWLTKGDFKKPKLLAEELLTNSHKIGDSSGKLNGCLLI